MKAMAKQCSRTGTLRGGRPAFLLILVLVVVAIASLAGLTFSRSMLITHEMSQISGARLQARMAAESGLQSVRLFVAMTRSEQLEAGGYLENERFFARNVIPSPEPQRRANFTIISPALDEFGTYTGLRYGLQNESSKLNLNALAQLDALAAAGDVTAAATGGGGGGAEDAISMLASEMTSDVSSTIAADMLLAIPGMTETTADCILDWLDEDEESRPYGAEFDDYYSQLPTPYKPANGPINSIEQLLLVAGVTPQLLFGYDENRNGVLDDGESQRMNSGVPAGSAPGSLATSAVSTDPEALPPPALGWSQYLTVYSMEKNIDQYGVERVNINGDDIELLYEDLLAVLGDETAASFIVAYRYSGSPGGDGTSPLVTLATMAAAEADDTDGALGEQLSALTGSQGGGAQGGAPAQPWSIDAFGSFDLTQAGSVSFGQVLDLFDATITVQQGNNEVTYASPFSSDPVSLAISTPLLMDALTTVDAPGVPGRINIMTCPAEILYGIPGLSDETVEAILEARVDGSESETRKYETWLAAEAILTMSELRALTPLITCGGDVYKAQVIGYMEGTASFSRLEAIISGVGDVPEILFFRRLDHLTRGFDIPTLGQRFDAGLPGGTIVP